MTFKEEHNDSAFLNWWVGRRPGSEPHAWACQWINNTQEI